MAVSTRKRFEVFKRDAFTCQYCGQRPPDVVLHVDHVIAVANGGSSGMENLVTSCATCNLGKHAVPLTSIPDAPAFPSDLAERRKQLKAYTAWQNEVRTFEQQQLDRVIAHWETNNSPLPLHQRRLLPGMIKRLGEDAVLEAMDIATSSGYGWRYACGVMWNRINPLRKLTSFFVVCTHECKAMHANFAWVCGPTKAEALRRFESVHKPVLPLSADVYHVVPGTTMDKDGEWVLPSNCMSPPVIFETMEWNRDEEEA